MKEESLLLLSDLQKLINQVVLIDYTIIILGEVMYCFNDRNLEEWFDFTREEILKILSSMCEEIGIHGLRFPRNRYKW